MCLYDYPRLYGATKRVTYPDAGDDGDDLEAGEALPLGDPRLQEGDVVAVHELQAAR
jgi:hypothetical protein